MWSFRIACTCNNIAVTYPFPISLIDHAVYRWRLIFSSLYSPCHKSETFLIIFVEYSVSSRFRIAL